MKLVRHGVVRPLGVALVLSVVAIGLAVSLPGAGARVEAAPSRTYLPASAWSYGPTNHADPDHIAYAGLPLTGFSSLVIDVLVVHNNMDDTELYADLALIGRQVSMTGISGATASFVPFGGGDIIVECVNGVPPMGSCPVPSNSYTVTLQTTWSVRDGACYRDWRRFSPGESLDELCPESTVSISATRTVVGGPAPTTTTAPTDDAPTANFVAEPSSSDRFEVVFANRSTDDQDDREEMTYRWDFGDGGTSTEVSPTHRYASAGVFSVNLLATDRSGNTDTEVREVVIANPLVVNSTADRPAIDAVERGCDTGEVLEDEPECTLRAAIEAADVAGGGEITFAIDGSGIPTIATGSPLPSIAVPVVVDGASQPGGWVALSANGERGIELAEATSTVRGLAISGVPVPIVVTGGSGHEIVGNRLGTGPMGTSADGVAEAVGITVPDVRFAENVVAAAGGLALTADATGAVIEDNFIGVSETGVVLGTTRSAIVTLGGGSVVRRNTMTAELAGIVVHDAPSGGATVSGNRIGVGPNGAQLGASGEGIRINGAPNVTVTDNVVSTDGEAAIAVAGSVQSTDENGLMDLHSPSSVPLPGPVTGGEVTVSGNTISSAPVGVVAWAGADRTTVAENTLLDVRTGIRVRGGSSHVMTGNAVGDGVDDVLSGIVVDDVGDSVIGGEGTAGNAIVSSTGGISVLGSSDGVAVRGNSVTGGRASQQMTGIRVGDEPEAVVVESNTVTGGSVGIDAGADGTSVRANTVSGAGLVGIRATGDDASVSGSVVTGSGDGIAVEGQDVTVERNRIGVDAGSTVVGNTGAGVVVGPGAAVVERNVVAGSGSAGIVTLPGADADLRRNRIWASEGLPIASADGPAPPDLRGVIRSGRGDDLRTTLLVAVPTEGGGRLEVFANDDCDDPEARYDLGVVRTTLPGRSYRVIQFTGHAARDHFTITYTADGRTSPLSACGAVQDHADADGDGSVDPIDGLVGADEDPRNAVVATDDESLLLVSLADDAGRLERVALGADPAPGSHPEGWRLAYGALGFRVAGLAPGASATVTLADLDGRTTAGDSYWKYGPPTAGAASRWYSFTVDAGTRTGATLTTTTVLGEFRRVWALQLRDGARGDSDGGANGTITDPGGPVIGGEAMPSDPSVTVPPVTVGGPDSAGASTQPGPEAVGRGTPSGPLPRTGVDPGLLIMVAMGSLVIGGALLRFGRRRRSVAAST